MFVEKLLLLLLLPSFFLLSGCGRIHEVVTSNPPGADIYWGKTAKDMERTGFKTTNSRSMGGSEWESWCYQAKMEGYKDTEIVCKPEEGYRYVNFNLEPVQTSIDSDPPGATIYWGSTKDGLEETIYRTPHMEKTVYVGANYKDWYFQVRKKGYKDSEIVFLPQNSSDRKISFRLQPAGEEDKKN